MGHHYNPQRLLRNFQFPDQPGCIWQHDKQGDTPVCAAIKNVAQGAISTTQRPRNGSILTSKFQVAMPSTRFWTSSPLPLKSRSTLLFTSERCFNAPRFIGNG